MGWNPVNSWGQMSTSPSFEQTCRESLIGFAKAYADATGLSLATVSRQFHGNHKFFEDYETGERSITISKAQEILDAFGAKWPTGKRRPKRRKATIRLGKKVHD